MGAEETELEMAERHVQEGRVRVARQRALIARLRGFDLPTGDAETLLYDLERAQRLHENHLARIQGRQI